MITRENYYDAEKNVSYMSVTQVKSFLSCEAAALAELRGETVRETTPSMLVGSYVDAHFSGTLDIFRAKHPDIFTRSGELKADFRMAENIIARIERDEFFMKYVSGEQQVVKTGELFGFPFKIRMDSYHPGKAIVDLKIMRDMSSVYKPGEGRQTFVEAWGYDIQGAIYQAVEGNDLPFYLAVATKEKCPDIAVIKIPQEVLDGALAVVERNVTRIDALKRGLTDPVRCEKCDYCKQTKILTRAAEYDELEGAI